MSGTQIVVTVIAVAIVVAAAAFAWSAMRRRALRERFGPEYDRLVEEQDRGTAERELRERERQHATLTLRPLSAESRARYTAGWEDVQVLFVDEPARAVSAADELVTRLIAERGYPTADYDEQLAHLSVEHARVLGDYRDAHDVHLSNERGEASTEQLRQALVHYRAVAAAMLGDDPVPTPDADAEAREARREPAPDEPVR